jgi:rSAM/selenodomain-associated transferase 1
MNPEKGINKKACVILMAKYPIIGTVKTRLACRIGDKYALDLYKLFIIDIMNTIQKENINLQIAYTPLHQLDQFKEWLGDHHGYLPQIGDTLGERLISVFKAAFASGIECAVALAGDTPDLPAHIISESLKKLSTSDMVIGPCPDGGYYLIGFRTSTFTEEVFRLDAWSTNDVFHNTIKKIEETGLNYHVLPFWSDIDDIDGLKEMVERNKKASELASIRFIKNNSKLLE